MQGWNGLGTLWGALRAGRGGNRTGESGPLSRQSYRIYLRAAPPGQSDRPRPGQRLVMGARVFRINAVADEEPGGRLLLCRVVEEVAS